MFTLPLRFDGLSLNQSCAKNLQAAIVLFLVALPLNIGVAIASGVPAYLGVVSGIVGAIVVGPLSGAPLMVSGPDAGIGVLVLEMIEAQGIEKLGVIVVLAGLIQLVLGISRFAKWYRIFSPAVVNGMLCGMGVIIILTQFHIMLDSTPQSTGVANLLEMPAVILKALTPKDGLTHHPAACIGMLTITMSVLWTRLSRGALKNIPAALVAIVTASAATALFNLPIQLIRIPLDMASSIKPASSLHLLSNFADPQIWMCACTLAFVASAQSIITATAVDQARRNGKANLDRELVAQGVGNIVCGVLGSLPVAGVLLRSMANLQTGATSRLANIAHGCFIVLAIASCPKLLNMMPASALAAILVLIGWRMVVSIYANVKAYERWELGIVVATVVAILVTNLFTGVVFGFALSAVKELSSLAHLSIKLAPGERSDCFTLYLTGAATFLQLPRLIDTLDSLPPKAEVHIRLDGLSYIDHGCLELMTHWTKLHHEQGGKAVIDFGPIKECCQSEHLQRRRVPHRIRSLSTLSYDQT